MEQLAVAAGTALAQEAVKKVTKAITKKKAGKKQTKKPIKPNGPGMKKNIIAGPNKAVMAPVAIGSKYKSYHTESPGKRIMRNKWGKEQAVSVVTCKGKFILSKISNYAVVFQDSFQRGLTPICAPGSMLYKRAQTYQKFKFKRITLHYQPTCSSSTTGAFMTYFLDDPEAQISSNKGNISYLNVISELKSSIMSSAWEPHTLVRYFPDDGSYYYVAPDTDQEERLSVQGVMGVLEAAAVGVAVDCGYLWLEYEVDLWEDANQSFAFDTMLNVPSYNTANVPNLVDGSPGSFTSGASVNNSANSTTQSYASVYTYFNAQALHSGSSTWTAGGLYSIIPTYNYGKMKAYNVYYIWDFSYSGPSNSGGTYTPVYTNINDCSLMTSENVVPSTTRFSTFADISPNGAFILIKAGDAFAPPVAVTINSNNNLVNKDKNKEILNPESPRANSIKCIADKLRTKCVLEDHGDYVVIDGDKFDPKQVATAVKYNQVMYQ